MPLAGGGSGGTPNVLPGRGFAEYGSATYRDASDWSGGARGPAALPARTIAVVGNGPAPADPRIATSGWRGTVSVHRGAFVEDAGAPRRAFDNVLGHGSVPWSRPVYANRAGLDQFVPPRRGFSWTANDQSQQDGPRSAIRVQRKQIGNFTVRRPYGDTSSGELFRTGSLADWVASLPSGMNMQGRRWLNQSKTHNPTLLPRSKYATAGSYGQTTPSAATLPSNTPISNPYGSY